MADMPVSTHSGAGMLLGIDPDDIRRLARGPVEAAGIGLDGHVLRLLVGGQQALGLALCAQLLGGGIVLFARGTRTV